MSCSSCKKKNKNPLTKEEINKVIGNTEKIVVGFTIVWFIFGAYGLYRFITDLL